MSWWTKIKAVVAQADRSSREQPVVHEPLNRHRERADELNSWQQGIVCEAISAWLRQAYGEYLVHGEPLDQAVDFLDTPSAKGFVIHFHRLQYSLFEAEMFQLHLRERVLAKAAPEKDFTNDRPAYRTQVADVKIYSAAGQTERTDRYYLKPRLVPHADPAVDAAPNTWTAEQFGQGYGNILLELVVRNDQPYRLRFSATTYHDRVYQRATGFPKLMQDLLTVA